MMKKKTIFNLRPFLPALKVNADSTIAEMAQIFLNHPQQHHLCVMDVNDELIGLINRQRIFQAVFFHHIAVQSRVHELFTMMTSENAGDLVLRDIQTIRESDEIDTAISLLNKLQTYELPVVDDQNGILGFLTVDSLLQVWLSETQTD